MYRIGNIQYFNGAYIGNIQSFLWSGIVLPKMSNVGIDSIPPLTLYFSPPRQFRVTGMKLRGRMLDTALCM